MKYSKIKSDERAWFQKFSPHLPIHHGSDPLLEKFYLMKALKSQTIKELSNSVTKIWPIEENYHGKKISYRYQRQDFNIQGTSPIEVYYPGQKSSLSITGHFTRSGQSATFGLLYALKNHNPDLTFRILSSKIYFETRRVLEALKISTNKISEIGFLDSSSLEHPPLEYLQDVTLKELIVDTTNWNLDSEKLASIIGWCEENQVDLFLIRSHLKLDSLGAEYGLLGSVVKLVKEESLAWNKSFFETLSHIGIIAIHEQVYPFLWDEGFLRLTRERTKRIQANTNYLVHHLKPFLKTLKNKLRVQEFDHGLFFGIYYSGQTDYMPEKFLKLALLNEVDARYCDSFGFDFLSLTNVVSYYENINESLLRFCSGDNTEKISDALKVIQDYLTILDYALTDNR